MNKNEFTFSSSNNVNTIHGWIWIPDEKPKAILQISHGMVEHIERYEEFAIFLTNAGVLVVGNDHLGHGESVDSKTQFGYFAKKEGSMCVVNDLHYVTRMMKQEYPDLPYFLLGHSMGSFMARRYIMTYGKELTGAIIVGTGNKPQSELRMGKALVRLETLLHDEYYRSKPVHKMVFGIYNRKIENPQTKNDWLSTDTDIVDICNKDPKCNFIFTLNGFQNLLDTILYIVKDKNINKIPKTLPILIASGKEDPVGNYGEEVICVFENLKKAGILDVELKLYEGCRHEILNEVIRQSVYQDMLDWVLKHL